MRPLFILLCLLIAALPARADDLAALLEKLPAGSYSDRIAVVGEIAALGDARAVPVLEALAKGNLRTRKSDKRLVLAIKDGKQYALSDPLSGEDLGAVKPVRRSDW